MSKLNKTYGNLENVGYALGKICEAFCAKKTWGRAIRNFRGKMSDALLCFISRNRCGRNAKEIRMI